MSARHHRLAAWLATAFTALALIAVGIRPAHAVVNVNMASYGALCNGSHDDRAALVSALAAVQSAGGGSVTVPTGTCRILQTASTTLTAVNGPVTIKGASTTGSVLSLDTDSAGAYRELLRVGGSNVALQNLTLTRQSNVAGILVNIGASSGLSMNNVVFDGKRPTIASPYFHAMQLIPSAGQTVSNVNLTNITVKNSDFGLYQASNTLGTVNGITVDHGTFTNNYGDDLEFNAPSSSMSNITVKYSNFSNNKYTDPSVAAGIGVGFANVQTGKVLNSTFSGYKYDPIHIEDRSNGITIDSNQISNSFTAALNYASLVFIINNSKNIYVTNNTFDTSANSNSVACIYASSGGGTAPPSYITITGNTFKLRPNAVDFANYGAAPVTKSNNTYVTLP